MGTRAGKQQKSKFKCISPTETELAIFYFSCLPIRVTVAQVVEQAFHGYKTFHPKLCVCDDCSGVRLTATLPQSAPEQL